MSIYVKFGDVEGECQDKGHVGWTNASSMTLTMNKPGESLTGQSRRRGDVKIEDLQITKELDKSSSSLGKNICIGMVFPKVIIHFTASYTASADSKMGGRQTYLGLHLQNVAVSSYSLTGDGEEPPTEEIGLNFEIIHCTYVSYKQDGSKLGEHPWGWDIEKSEEVGKVEKYL